MDWVFKILQLSIKTVNFVDRVFKFWQPSTKLANIVDEASNQPQM